MKIFGLQIGGKKQASLQPQSDDYINPDNSKSITDSELGTLQKMVEQVVLPSKGGRSSSADEGISFGSYINGYATINPDFPRRFYDALENLTKYNPDVSLAVENIVTLGNTTYTISFDDEVDDDQAKEMISYLKRKTKKWYQYSEGLNGLINDLLTQAAVFGSLSAEGVVSKNLDGIDKIVLVPPKEIHFKYNRAKDVYDPYQKVDMAFGINKTTDLGLIPLNPITYKYIGVRRLNSRPYGIPPFLAAFDNLSIEDDMMCNFKNIIRKLGFLGFLQILLTAPQMQQGETLDAYRMRCAVYLKEAIAEAETGFNNGLVAGFKDSHEFKMQPTTTNIAGAKDLFDLNDNLKMSGLKQDPLMFGRNFSTTETLGRVILAKTTTQIGNYQKIVAAFLEDMFLMDLILAGFNVSFIEVIFDKPTVSDKVKDEQAFSQRIDNYDKLYKQGVISQQKRAQALGWEKPDLEEPRYDFTSDTLIEDDNDTDDKEKEDTANTDNTDIKENSKKKVLSTVEDLEKAIRGAGEDFNYGHDCECHGHFEHYATEDSNLDETFFRVLLGYDKEITDQYRSVAQRAARAITNALASMNVYSSYEQVVDKVFYELYLTFYKEFGKPQQAVIRKWVEDGYKAFRQDVNVFGQSFTGTIPTAAFDLLDIRAIEYFRNADQFYLGRFITDASTKKKINKWIRDKYLLGSTPIGNNKAAIADFRKQFAGVLEGEDWKVHRIIETSVNRMRNTANLNYLRQGNIQRFVIRGVRDSKQCGYCAAMQGKSFDVVKAMEKVESYTAASPDTIGISSPFINSVFRGKEGLEELMAMDSAAIQSAGIDLPPYHSNCRDRIVADI